MDDTQFAAIALATAFTACITDLRHGRIPNALTFGSAALALCTYGVVGGWDGLLTAGGGWLLGTALFLPFFLLGGMGAGDVKLLAALGAWLGPHNAFWLAVYGLMAGGAVSLVVAVARGYLFTALRNIWMLLKFWWLVGPRPVPGATLADYDGPRLAYAVPIFLGTVAVLWLR